MAVNVLIWDTHSLMEASLLLPLPNDVETHSDAHTLCTLSDVLSSMLIMKHGCVLCMMQIQK